VPPQASWRSTSASRRPFVLASTMLYLVPIQNVIAPVNVLVCASCLVLMFLGGGIRHLHRLQGLQAVQQAAGAAVPADLDTGRLNAPRSDHARTRPLRRRSARGPSPSRTCASLASLRLGRRLPPPSERALPGAPMRNGAVARAVSSKLSASARRVRQRAGVSARVVGVPLGPWRVEGRGFRVIQRQPGLHALDQVRVRQPCAAEGDEVTAALLQ